MLLQQQIILILFQRNIRRGICQERKAWRKVQLKPNRDFKSRGFYTPDVLHKKLEHISKAYRQITKIVQEQVEEREEHSYLFTLIQIFVDQLEPIIECFNQYRNKPLSEDYVENFKQYSKEITRGMSAANGLRSVMKTYNDLIDREKSAKRWMEKHPEWAEGKWKPGKKLEKKN